MAHVNLRPVDHVKSELVWWSWRPTGSWPVGFGLAVIWANMCQFAGDLYAGLPQNGGDCVVRCRNLKVWPESLCSYLNLNVHIYARESVLYTKFNTPTQIVAIPSILNIVASLHRRVERILGMEQNVRRRCQGLIPRALGNVRSSGLSGGFAQLGPKPVLWNGMNFEGYNF